MLQDSETGRLDSGFGHCLFPSNDPEVKAYKIKPSFPVEFSLFPLEASRGLCYHWAKWRQCEACHLHEVGHVLYG